VWKPWKAITRKIENIGEYNKPSAERERREGGRKEVTDATFKEDGETEINFSAIKVPRQCPLVLVVMAS
jgi:hypothetical protein